MLVLLLKQDLKVGRDSRVFEMAASFSVVLPLVERLNRRTIL